MKESVVDFIANENLNFHLGCAVGTITEVNEAIQAKDLSAQLDLTEKAIFFLAKYRDKLLEQISRNSPTDKKLPARCCANCEWYTRKHECSIRPSDGIFSEDFSCQDWEAQG